MTPKKCMAIAKSLTDTQHMELEPLCSAQNGGLCVTSSLTMSRGPSSSFMDRCCLL